MVGNQKRIEEKLCAFIVKCMMTLHSERNKTEAQLGTVVHRLYKGSHHKELK